MTKMQRAVHNRGLLVGTKTNKKSLTLFEGSKPGIPQNDLPNRFIFKTLLILKGLHTVIDRPIALSTYF